MAIISKERADALLRCNKCGFCLAHCPIYKVTGIEWAGARGRIALIRSALLDDKLDISELDAPVFNCLTCDACTDDCPAGVQVAEIIFNTREELYQQRGESWITQLVFSKLLASPPLLHKASRLLRLADVVGIRKVARKIGLIKIMGDAGKAEAMVPAVPSGKGLAEIMQLASEIKHPAYRVAYFVGCYAANLDPGEASATIRILHRHRVEVIIPEFVCCGIPAPAYGDMSSARSLARRNIDIVGNQDVDAIVTSCSSCSSFLKEYTKLLADEPEWAQKARDFSNKVKDLTEFLDAIGLATIMGNLRKKVTYHDPCHLARYQKISQQPRTILKNIPGIEFIELKEADMCCGAAGSYGFSNFDLSMKVLDRKMENIGKTNAEIVVSCCPSCIMQLTYGTKNQQIKVDTLSIVKLLDQVYGMAENI